MAALALTPLPSLGLSSLVARTPQSLEKMSYSLLASQVDTPFLVLLSPHNVVELTLLKAPLAPRSPSALGRRPPGDACHEKFSLIFDGPKDSLLASAIHHFEHRHLGRFEMSISQIGAREDLRVRYEAVFNRPAITTQT
ncbi:MAG: hypothetical protein JWN25_1340 [Verrucomicrobiales bacterium]|nr:hypothetical protein [Verrucomicrobiales bacterium]